MIAITGATGQLGQYVIEELLKTVPANEIVAIVRNPAKADALSQQGIVVRQADYTNEAAFTAALSGVDKLLLISSSEVGQRATQHQNVINAAKAAGVKFIAYTNLLNTSRRRKRWRRPAFLMPCCAMAGIPKTIWQARHRRLSMACL